MSLKDRIDLRTIEEFAKALQYHDRQELVYVIDYMNRHNRNRKKRSIAILPLGEIASDVVGGLGISRYGRPDFLIMRCFDNSYIVKTITPLEVSHSKAQSIERFYLKQEKVERKYNQITPMVTSIQQSILCILGENGLEQYYLLTPESPVFKRMKARGPVAAPPYVFGATERYPEGKPAYWFYREEVDWKPLYQSGQTERLIPNSNI